MAKGFEDITVDVKAKLSVDRGTAEACLKMVELYINANRDKYIVCNKLETGEEEFKIATRRADNGSD